MNLELISSLVGLLTAIAAFLAIAEMKVQRVLSYKPDLVLQAPTLRFEAAPGFPPIACSRKTKGADQPKDTSVGCINVGVGVARDLLANWHFDHQEAVAAITPFVRGRGYTVWLEDGSTKIQVEEGGETRLEMYTGGRINYRKPYLCPIQDPSHVFKVPLPPEFVLFMRLGLVGVPGQRVDEPSQFTIPDPPVLNLQIYFTDTGGARRSADFQVRYRFGMYRSTTTESGELKVEVAEANATIHSPSKWWRFSSDKAA